VNNINATQESREIHLDTIREGLGQYRGVAQKFIVKSIKSNQTHEWLLNKHYMKRLTCISYAFGLFYKNELMGICTYGSALPSTMRRGVCGIQYESIVYELNRLCIDDAVPKNTLSFFVAQTLRLLSKPKILVSYADIAVGHNGYIYQATNWIYTGLSHTQKDWKLKGREHLHSRTLMDEFPFQKDRIKKLKEKYGDDLYQIERKPKNRYVYLIGTKKQKKEMLKELKYEIMPYPKGANKRYDASYKPIIQRELFTTI